MTRAATVLLVLLTIACPGTAPLQCPTGTTLVGHYNLGRTGITDAAESCVYYDAGKAFNLAAEAGTPQEAMVCFATLDAGPQLRLLVAGKGGERASSLLPDGGFHFVSDPAVAQFTSCICDVNVNESFNGYLLTSGAFTVLPDGGLPVVTGLTGTQSDLVTVTSSSCDANCNVPCTVAYSVTSSPF